MARGKAAKSEDPVEVPDEAPSPPETPAQAAIRRLEHIADVLHRSQATALDLQRLRQRVIDMAGEVEATVAILKSEG